MKLKKKKHIMVKGGFEELKNDCSLFVKKDDSDFAYYSSVCFIVDDIVIYWESVGFY